GKPPVMMEVRFTERVAGTERQAFDEEEQRFIEPRRQPQRAVHQIVGYRGVGIEALQDRAAECGKPPTPIRGGEKPRAGQKRERQAADAFRERRLQQIEAERFQRGFLHAMEAGWWCGKDGVVTAEAMRWVGVTSAFLSCGKTSGHRGFRAPFEIGRASSRGWM